MSLSAEQRALTGNDAESSDASAAGVGVQDDFVASANGTTLRFGEEGLIIRCMSTLVAYALI